MGGNFVASNGIVSSKLDLTKIDRSSLVSSLIKGLEEINSSFFESNSYSLWSKDLINSRDFFSGSAFHLVDTTIENAEFVSFKPIIGDIDLKVDKDLMIDLLGFLQSGPSTKTILYVDHKKANSQIVSLWLLKPLGLYIQIDFELVDFIDGRPSQWAKFSRSSTLIDLKANIKGVFSKFLIRAITSKYLKYGIIKAKSKAGQDKIGLHPSVAFSIENGIRVKYHEHIGSDGNSYLIDSNEPGSKDLVVLFKTLFDDDPSGDDLKTMESFIGLVTLIKGKIRDRQTVITIVDGFFRLLWGVGAQLLYRNEPDRDREDKMIAWRYLTKALNVQQTANQTKQITQYYRSKKERDN